MKIKLMLEVTPEEATRVLQALDGTRSVEEVKAAVVQEPETEAEEEAPPVDVEEEASKENKNITQSDIRQLAVRKTKAGRANEVKEIIADYAEDGKLKSVAKSDYSALYRRLGELNG